MKCFRCGYCCISLDVIIVNAPELGIVEDNLIHKASGIKCPHLKGEIPGEYKCLIHTYNFYKETPCFTHNTDVIGKECRLGKHIINGKL